MQLFIIIFASLAVGFMVGRARLGRLYVPRRRVANVVCSLVDDSEPFKNLEWFAGQVKLFNCGAVDDALSHHVDDLMKVLTNNHGHCVPGRVRTAMREIDA